MKQLQGFSEANYEEPMNNRGNLCKAIICPHYTYYISFQTIFFYIMYEPLIWMGNSTNPREAFGVISNKTGEKGRTASTGQERGQRV